MLIFLKGIWDRLGWSGRVICLLVIVLGVMGYRQYDLNKKLARETAERQTLDSKFQKFGDSYQTRAEIFKNNKEAIAEALGTFGKPLVDEMKANRAQLLSVTTALGRVNGSVQALGQTDGPVESEPQGGFKNLNLVQNRAPNPPLTEVHLDYDATKGPERGVTGSWINNREVYTASFGQWLTDGKGYKSAVTLERSIFKTDPKDPSKQGPLLGKEKIAIDDAVAKFTPEAFDLRTPQPLPKWLFGAGGAYDFSARQWNPVVTADYRVTKSFGVGGGVILGGKGTGTQGLVILSYRK